METDKIELKQIQKIDEAIAYLEGLLKGFKAGTIVVRQGEEEVVMNPPAQVAVEISAKKKKEKEKFSLELSWQATAAPGSRPVTVSGKSGPCTPGGEKMEKPSAPAVKSVEKAGPVAGKPEEKGSPAPAAAKEEEKGKPAARK